MLEANYRSSFLRQGRHLSIIRPFGPIRTTSSRNYQPCQRLIPAAASPLVAAAAWSSIMHGSSWTPTIVPYGADQTIYLVVDRFERPGRVYRETEVERTDLETIITDLMSGQFNDPVRVVAFNTLEHWSEDVSKGIALEIQARCDIDGQGAPESIRDFVDSHVSPRCRFRTDNPCLILAG
jgi:hypothetical protein